MNKVIINNQGFKKLYDKMYEEDKKKLYNKITNKDLKLKAENDEIGTDGYIEKYFNNIDLEKFFYGLIKGEENGKISKFSNKKYKNYVYAGYEISENECTVGRLAFNGEKFKIKGSEFCIKKNNKLIIITPSLSSAKKYILLSIIN